MKENLDFEKSLAKLEEIVENLENGQLSLDKSYELFEKGIKLSKYCEDTLHKAEKKVEILLSDNQDNLKQQPFNENNNKQVRKQEETGK